MSDNKHYSQMFEYLSTPALPPEASGVFVFGRYDTRLVRKMSELATRGMADYFLITGALGKDSGYLHELNIPEADYLAAVAVSQDYGIPPGMIYRETKALNGGDNARLGLKVIGENDLSSSRLTALAHATSLRRLAATLEFEGGKMNATDTIYRIPTDYPFDPSNPIDRAEASAEVLRLADWPAKGWLAVQPDLPENMVDFARSNS